MGKKLPTTPRGRVTSALRMLWLHSRERAAALKAADHRCARCGVKESKAKGKEQKIQVHHKDGINNWKIAIDTVFKELLPTDITKLECLCPECHEKEHGGDNGKQEANQT